jgi:membrane protease YdiL (CAAX protease family)
MYLVVMALLLALPNTLGEKLGWRGFALPRLQVKYKTLAASVLLGLFWAVWHIPMWIANYKFGLDLLRSMVAIIAYTTIFTCVYNSTSGSVLLTWLFHASITITQNVPQTPLTLTDGIVGWGVAIIVVIMAGATHLSHTPNTDVKRASGV